MEENCKWHFGKEGGIDIGPNDPIHQTFKGNPYYSIVREAIQNSLDAVYDNSLPVTVSFQYFDLYRMQYPLFFQLEEHINQALEFYKTNRDAQRLFGDMLRYLNGNETGRKKSKISCLRISDSNTKGMHFNDGTDSPFYAFLRAAGVSAKMSGGAGGSFGFGKGAYFALSPIKTLVVSSKDINGNVYFEGATRITTHKNDFNEKLTAYGFYDNNNGNPTSIVNNIPEIFTRDEIGTDINVIGLWDEINKQHLMIKSVLNNFWLAIHEQKLIVTVNDKTISKENLEQVINRYFSTEFEGGSTTDIETWNPKPYYRAVKYANENDQFKLFNDELPTLGRVRLFVHLEKGLPNRISFFRKLNMVVYKKTYRKINGFAGVLICENTEGNEILRMMENPAHNEWKKENYPTDEGKINSIARNAEKEIGDYLNSKLDSLAKLNTSKKVVFLGLEEFLSIPEDLIEKDDTSDIPGENTNNNSGSPTKEITHDETGMQTTNKDKPITIKPTIRKLGEVKNDQDVELSDEGNEKILIGGENKESGGDEPGTINGTTGDIGILANEPKESRVLINVKLKVAAQKEEEILYHNLIVGAEKDFANAELELLVSGDNDKDDGVSIISSSNGNIQGNKLKAVALLSGRNPIKIRFADNLKHSIKIKAYEVR